MKNLIKIMICFSLIYTPFFSMSANAANVGGWNLSNPIAQGASTVYDATKKIILNGKDFVKTSTVKITPTVTQVSKILVKGGAGYAMSVAVEQLIGAVDWVLDPSNNQIIYTDKKEIPITDQYYTGHDSRYRFATSDEALLDKCISVAGHGAKIQNQTKDGIWYRADCFRSGFSTPSYVVSTFLTVVNETEVEEEQKSLPIDAVAQQVITNAESGDTNAQTATTAAASDTVAESEKDDTKARPIVTQAESNSQTSPMDETGTRPQTQAESNTAQGTQTQNPANPAQTDLALEFPVFCNWAPTICEAAQVVISFPQTLTGWWDTANHKVDEWVTSISEAYHDFINDDELPNEETKVDITDIPTPELQENAISWGASCPADVSLPISMQGVSSTIVFSWSPWCQLLSIIKPAIVASAYIGAAFIVLGLRT